MKPSQPSLKPQNADTAHIWYYDLLRVVATFFVIMLHVTSANVSALDYTTTEWKIHVLYNGASRWAVPVFVMLSGALFLNPNKQINTGILYHRHIPKMLLTFLGWSLFYAVVYTIRMKEITPSTFLYLIVCGYSHMWFIHLIISLYMLVPVLRKISEDCELLKYIVPIGLVAVFVFPAIIDFLSQFDSKLIQRILPIISDMFHATAFAKASEYVLYYLLGYCLSFVVMKSKSRFWIYAAGICGLGMTVFLTLWATDRSGIKTGQYYEPQAINVLLMSTAVFVCGRYGMSHIQPGEKTKQALLFLSKHSFTIYLVHMLIIDLFGDFGLQSMCFHPMISIPILATLVFLLSLLVAVLIGYIKAHCTLLRKG